MNHTLDFDLDWDLSLTLESSFTFLTPLLTESLTESLAELFFFRALFLSLFFDSYFFLEPDLGVLDLDFDLDLTLLPFPVDSDFLFSEDFAGRVLLGLGSSSPSTFSSLFLLELLLNCLELVSLSSFASSSFLTLLADFLTP